MDYNETIKKRDNHWKKRFGEETCKYCGGKGVSRIYADYSCHEKCERNNS